MPLVSTHSMVSRAQSDIFKQKIWVAKSAPSSADWLHQEPTHLVDALTIPTWRTTMEGQILAMHKNKMWVLVPPSSDQNVVGYKLVFKINKNSDGSIQRYKARLVVKGFHQNPGIYLYESYSSVVKSSTICVVLSLAVSYSLSIRQLDFNNAFLNDTLHETLYMG